MRFADGPADNPDADGGASGEEMMLSEIGDLDLELILRGEAPAGPDEGTAELAEVVRELHEAVVRPPDPGLAERHVAALVTESRRIASLAWPQTAANGRPAVDSSPAAAGASAQVSVRRPPTRRGRFVPLRLAAVGLAALLGTASLAIAGVRPPEPIADGLEALGIGVPGDDGAREEAPPPEAGDRPPAPPRAPSGADAGKPGAAGEAAAGRRHGGARRGDRTERSGRDDRRRRRHGQEASAEGRETATEAQSGSAPPSKPEVSEDHSQGAAPPQDPGRTPRPHRAPPTSAPGASATTPAATNTHGGPALGDPEAPGR